MADSVDSKILRADNQRYTVRITNASDGTGESAVVKVDASGLTTKHGYTLKAVDVRRVFGQVGGFNYVTLAWDADTDDEILVLTPGSFDYDYNDTEPLKDPLSTGWTRDIVLTTDGAVDGASYDLTLECELRYGP